MPENKSENEMPPEECERCKDVLDRIGWSQGKLAKAIGLDRSTVNSTLNGNHVHQNTLKSIREKIDSLTNELREQGDITFLVDNVRNRAADTICSRCGKLNFPLLPESIPVESLYTKVNILQNITSYQWKDEEELIKEFGRESFERATLSHIQDKRVPGLEAALKYPKLMILGKPGSGKTTFLKWLAIQNLKEVFKPDQIPIFISLKDLAETKPQITLVEYIENFLKSFGVEDAIILNRILKEGHILLLLDGLDEVQSKDKNQITQAVQNFQLTYSKCNIFVTCRIAERGNKIESLKQVEIADFDEEQIEAFSRKWFREENTIVSSFIQELKENPRIRELAITPLLLALICFVYEGTKKLPKKRSELYSEAFYWLLKKWDDERNIERDLVYRQLTPLQKEELLSEIAASNFIREEYFFKRESLARQISSYLKKLPYASNDIDGYVVLESIELQHGLVVQRARGFYSFSHLTFQEFLTARYFLIRLEEQKSETLQELSNYFPEIHWREVFLLLTEMLPGVNYVA